MNTMHGVLLIAGLVAGCTTPPTVDTSATTLTALTVTAPTVTIVAGDIVQLQATGSDAGGMPLALGAVSWASDNLEVAAVSASGLVRANAPGSVRIRASQGSVYGVLDLTIGYSPNEPSSLLISGPISLREGSAAPFMATALNYFGDVVANAPLTWHSSDTVIATVTQTGIVQALKTGAVAISVNSARASTSRQLVVMPGPTALKILPSTLGTQLNLITAQTAVLSVLAYGQDGALIDHPDLTDLTWSTSQPDIVSITNFGVARGVVPGVAVVRATLRDLTAQLTIAVTAATTISSGGSNVLMVHAAAGGTVVTFHAGSAAPATLAFGESQSVNLPSGTPPISVEGMLDFADGPIGPYDLPLTTVSHATAVLFGGDGKASLIVLSDDHPPIPADRALVRVLMAGEYEVAYFTNDVYLVDPGAPPSANTLVLGSFETPQATGFISRPVGRFDLLFQDAAYRTASNQIPAAEAARFTLTPEPGRATTYIITGGTRGTLSLITVVDP